MWPPPPHGTWVVDLDGVVWLAGKPIPGVDEAVARLRSVGVRVLFATNNALPTRAELHRQLAHCGITTDDADLLRSADVAAGMLTPGSTTVVLGGDGVLEALAARGVLVVPEGPADNVLVGLARDFTYDSLSRAVAAVRGGARLVGTNEDATYPTPDGLVPGAGSILAAVVTAGGKAAEVAGKPNRPTADAIAARVGSGELRVMVGDRPSTDGALAAELGIPFGLVLSGVTEKGEIPDDADPAAVAPDFLRLVEQALGEHPVKCLQPASTLDTLV